MLRIGIDIDDTLCDVTNELMKYFVQYLKESVKNNDCISLEKTLKLLQEFIYSSINNVTPLPYSQECLSRLQKSGKFEFYAITSRDFEFAEQTKSWLDIHYPGIFSDVIICNIHGENEYPRLCKTDACKAFNIKYFLDAKSLAIRTQIFQKFADDEVDNITRMIE